jgi:hypothetical protein
VFPAAFVAIAQCETLKNSKNEYNSGRKHNTKRDKQQDTNKMCPWMMSFKKNPVANKMFVCLQSQASLYLLST